MATAYRVTAPYVVLKIRGTSGRPQVNGFYKGAIVTDDQVEKESLKRHLDRKMVERLKASEAKAEAKPAVKAAESKPAAKAAEPKKESPKADAQSDA